MLRFEKEQKIFDIGGIKIGGQPGEYPTVLIGSIFYERHKIVSDPLKGEFDEAAAEDLIKRLEELYDKTGNPFIVDVVGLRSEALIRYIEFVADVTEAPFLVDGPSAGVRIPAMKWIADTGLIDRAIYNSIDYNVSSDEISKLRELGVKSAVLMAYNPRNPWVEGRIRILKGWEGRIGLLRAAEEAGIKKMLIDTAVLDVPSLGLAAKAVSLIKSEYGLPAGCGPANAVTTWRRVKREYKAPAYHAAVASSVVINVMCGADFVLYGPIEFAESVYPSCAMTDAIIAYWARRMGVRPKVKNHPLFKIF